jgi:hypothetical protein
MELGAGHQGFNVARKDTISVLYSSWRGGSTVGYWIDHVLENNRQPDSGGGVVSGSGLTCTIAAGARWCRVASPRKTTARRRIALSSWWFSIRL